MIEFKEVEGLLHSIAGRYQDNRFQHDELINAVIVSGTLGKIDKIEYAPLRIRWAMLRYISDETNYGKKKWDKKAGNFIAKTFPMHNVRNNTSQIKTDDFEDTEFSDQCFFAKENNTKEFFDDVTHGMDKEARELIEARFIEGLTLREIAESLDSTTSRINNKINKLLLVIKEDLSKIYCENKAYINIEERKGASSRRYHQLRRWRLKTIISPEGRQDH